MAFKRTDRRGETVAKRFSSSNLITGIRKTAVASKILVIYYLLIYLFLKLELKTQTENRPCMKHALAS